MIKMSPEINVKMRLCLATCPQRQKISAATRRMDEKMKNAAAFVIASGIKSYHFVKIYLNWFSNFLKLFIVLNYTNYYSVFLNNPLKKAHKTNICVIKWQNKFTYFYE